MGSVTSYVDCPNCSNEMYEDFYYKTGELYNFCNHCGYQQNHFIKNRDKRLDELKEEDWDHREITNPFGAYSVKHKEAIATSMGTLMDQDQLESLKDEVLENPEIEYALISQFIDGQIKETYLVDNRISN